MSSAAIWTGRILVLIGIVGYAYGFYGGKASITAMIPAFFGIVITLLGHVAKMKESWSKHAMHLAMIVGLLGFLVPAARLVMKFSEITLSAAYVSQIAMALVCLAFVVLGIRSFIEARKS